MEPKDGLLAKRRVLESGCWEWLGWKNPDGYGRFVLGGVKTTVHRAAYQVFVGPVPAGHDVHHSATCTTRACFNPEHLEPLPKARHLRERHDCGAYQRAKTHCRQGHPYSAENTRINRDGSRACKTCERATRDRWRIENRSRYLESRRVYEAERRGPPVHGHETHCKRGHEFSPANTYINATSGARVCQTCMRIHTRNYRLRKKSL